MYGLTSDAQRSEMDVTDPRIFVVNLTPLPDLKEALTDDNGQSNLENPELWAGNDEEIYFYIHM